MKLAEKRCVPCEGGAPPLGANSIKKYKSQINKAWTVIDGQKLSREFKFKNFIETMGFVNRVALIAQAEDHHPDLQVFYSRVIVELWTHAASGLTENDFILAAKIDKLKL